MAAESVQQRVAKAIQRTREAEDRDNRPWPLLDLPINGKVIEPLIGRMFPVSDVIPPSIDITKLTKRGHPLPDPTKENLRSRPADVYDKSPTPEPRRMNTLAVISKEQPLIGIGLRDDISKKLLDRHVDEPYVAELGHGGTDRYTRRTEPRWRYEFLVGEVVQVPSDQAVPLLRHPMHGQWLEEKVPAPKPAKRAYKRKKTATKKE